MADEKGVFFSNEVLRSYGCRTCVWKELDECPNGYTKVGESTASGYCDKLLNYLIGLAGPDGDVDVALEKFHVHLRGEQTLLDRKDMLEKRAAYRSAVESGADRSKVERLKMEYDALKMWFHRFSESASRGFSRVNDRKAKKDIDIKVTQKLDLSQVHTLMREARKELEDNRD